MITYRKALNDDCADLAEWVRDEDVAEVRAASGMDVASVLQLGVTHSEPAIVACWDGMSVAMFGVVPSPSPDFGVIWLLGSNAINTHRRLFLRQSRPFVNAFHARWPALGNCVDERNTAHIRWLQWLGFTFIRRHPAYGFEKRPFLEFVRLRQESV